MSETIPAVWRIDIEPDEFQVVRGSWDGFGAMAALVNGLRPRLEDCSGFQIRPTWFIRFDPDIGRHFGRTDFVAERHSGTLDEIRGHGDPLGIHVHAHRWNEQRQVTYSDYADIGWATHCLEVSAETFERRFGEPVRRSSHGGYFLPEEVIDASVRLGIEVDVTPEPGLPALAADSSFGAYASAPSTDYRKYPRRPYYPSRHDASVPAASVEAGRPLLLVPLTAYDFRTALAPLGRRIRSRLQPWRRRHLPLNPWRSWPSPTVYWDLVRRAVAEQSVRYFAFAVRTDGPGSETHRRARDLLEVLPEHPIAKQLRFVDPLGPEIHRLATATGR